MTLLVAAVALVCSAGAILSSRSHLPASAEAAAQAAPLVLRMPFERGTVVWLMQGIQAPNGHTHRPSLPQNEFALDFATPTHDVVPVVSAAAGQVSFAYADSDPYDVSAGAGYGNHVKVRHRDGTYTFYAHLATVAVEQGDRVDAGARIGAMGRTGRAGIRHLHFSLHRYDANRFGGAPSLPIHHLVTMDVTAGDSDFRVMRSDELQLDYAQQFKGHLYASENAAEQSVLLGVPPEQLGRRIARQGEQVQQALDLQLRLAAIARRKDRDVAQRRADLEAIAAIDPHHPVMLYLRAVTVEMPTAQWRAAEGSLLAAAKSNQASRRYVPWLPGRVHFQRGRLARRAGQRQQARAHFQRAVELSMSRKQLADARRELELTGEP